MCVKPRRIHTPPYMLEDTPPAAAATASALAAALASASALSALASASSSRATTDDTEPSAAQPSSTLPLPPPSQGGIVTCTPNDTSVNNTHSNTPAQLHHVRAGVTYNTGAKAVVNTVELQCNHSSCNCAARRVHTDHKQPGTHLKQPGLGLQCSRLLKTYITGSQSCPRLGTNADNARSWKNTKDKTISQSATYTEASNKVFSVECSVHSIQANLPTESVGGIPPHPST